jgi:hypothetical protein
MEFFFFRAVGNEGGIAFVNYVRREKKRAIDPEFHVLTKSYSQIDLLHHREHIKHGLQTSVN